MVSKHALRQVPLTVSIHIASTNSPRNDEQTHKRQLFVKSMSCNMHNMVPPILNPGVAGVSERTRALQTDIQRQQLHARHTSRRWWRRAETQQFEFIILILICLFDFEAVRFNLRPSSAEVTLLSVSMFVPAPQPWRFMFRTFVNSGSNDRSPVAKYEICVK